MLILLILLTPLVFLLLLEIKNYAFKKIINRIPGPNDLPIIGNVHLMGKTPSANLELFFNWCYQYGFSTFRFWIGHYPHVIVMNIKDIEFVLTSTQLTTKAEVYNTLHPWLGTGLITSHGTKWFKHRKMITPSFHFKILQNFHEVMNSNSTKFIEKLRNVSAGETIFDFQNMVQYLTLDVISETAMGIEINAMDNMDSTLVTAFKDMCSNINIRIFHPLKRNNSIYKFFPEYAEHKKTLDILNGFTKEIIANRMEKLKNAEKSKESSAPTEEHNYSANKMAFLDTLLSATIDGKPLTLQEIHEEVSTFMFAGHDTTTSGISFAIYMLSRHPEVQQKVFEEQIEIMADNLKRDATFQEISEMKYLDLVIKEAQRLYPSVPMTGRFTDKEYNMNGTTLPKGTTVNLFFMGMGYNEKYFPDPYRCKPERFDANDLTNKISPFQYAPFSAGPRNCIGQKFALLELKTVISKIVRTFEILPPLDDLISKDGYVANFIGLPLEQQRKLNPNPSKYDPILSATLTLNSENGIHIRLKERKY